MREASHADRAGRKASSRAVVYNSAPSHRARTRKASNVAKTMKVALVAATALVLCGAGPGRSRPRPRPRTRLSLTAGQGQDGATKAAVCAACHGPERQQRQPRVAAPRRPERRVHRRAAAAVPCQRAHQPDDDAHRRGAHATRTSTISPSYYATQTPQGLEADPSYWKAGRGALSARRQRAQHPGLRRLPRPGGSRQSRRGLSGAARAALGVHGQAAERLRHRHTLHR